MFYIGNTHRPIRLPTEPRTISGTPALANQHAAGSPGSASKWHVSPIRHTLLQVQHPQVRLTDDGQFFYPSFGRPPLPRYTLSLSKYLPRQPRFFSPASEGSLCLDDDAALVFPLFPASLFFILAHSISDTPPVHSRKLNRSRFHSPSWRFSSNHPRKAPPDPTPLSHLRLETFAPRTAIPVRFLARTVSFRPMAPNPHPPRPAAVRTTATTLSRAMKEEPVHRGLTKID